MTNADIISKYIQELYEVRPSTAHMIGELVELLVNEWKKCGKGKEQEHEHTGEV